MQRSVFVGLAQDKKPLCKFPCLLNLPPANLDWSASFFGLSLSSVYWSQFQIAPRKLLRLQTNAWDAGLTVPGFSDSSLKIFHHFLATIVSNWKSVCLVVPLPPTSTYTHYNILVFLWQLSKFSSGLWFSAVDCDITPAYSFFFVLILFEFVELFWIYESMFLHSAIFCPFIIF